jgi:DNA-directed RNA polymerase specialized sigma subunit
LSDEALSARLVARLVDPASADLIDLLAAILEAAEGAIELDEVVSFVAALQGVRPLAEQSESETEDGTRQRADVADPRADVAAEVNHRLYLEHLWREINDLPPRQRLALLLNLRDAQGRDVIALLPITGVASLRQIATTLEIPAEEFAALWNDLPMDDARIAERLGLTRQQVINLRKSARERLMRRMKYH